MHVESLSSIIKSNLRSLKADSDDASRSTLKRVFNAKITPFFYENFAFIEDFIFELFKLLIQRNKDYWITLTSTQYANLFLTFGKFIGMIWMKHKVELFDILQVPVKKRNSLGFGKEPNVEEILEYLNVKTMKTFDTNRSYIFVRKKKNGGYLYKYVSNKNTISVEAYMKKCPTNVEIESWLQRGLRFCYVTREDVKKSVFAKFLPEESLSSLEKNNTGSTINENFVFHHSDLNMWINYNIYKKIVKYLDDFFPEGFKKNYILT